MQSNADVLALRQRLLRLRNTAPPTTNAAAATSPSVERALPAASHTTAATRANTSTTITPVQLQGRSASRQQSDAQKELGNTAMAEKLYSTAVMHYSNAIKFDATNLAAFNNRALAYLKLNDFALAESDASCVVESKDSANAGVQALRLKALCRRAQARRAMAEAHLAEATAAKSTDGKATAAKCAQDKLESSMRDLQQLLKDDANNKTALVEQKAVRDAMKRCSDLLEPAATVSGKQAASATSSSSASPMPVPRADPSRVSAMLSPSSTGSLSFGDIGLVARSSKKLRATADGTDTEVSPATPTPSAPPSGIGSNNSAKNGKGAVVSPPPSIALTAAPSDPPKTVYEYVLSLRNFSICDDLLIFTLLSCAVFFSGSSECGGA